MIPAAEMADIRATAVSALPDVCNIVTVGRSRDDRGQVTEVSVTGPDFPCHLATADPGQETELAGRISPTEAWTILMPLSTIVTASDNIGCDVEGDAAVYEVVGGVNVPSLAAYRIVLVHKAEAEAA